MDYYPYVRSVIDALIQASVDYMVVGALSSNVYGVTRSTRDADIVVELTNRRVSEISKFLGPEFVLDPQVAFDSVTGSYRHIFSLTDSTFKVELFRLTSDPHDRERFRRKVSVPQPAIERNIFVPTPEDVIIMKLRWAECLHRNKDSDDVRDVMSVQQNVLDWAYIERWTEEHGTTALYREIRSSIPAV
jgi:hypothetical protein